MSLAPIPNATPELLYSKLARTRSKERRIELNYALGWALLQRNPELAENKMTQLLHEYRNPINDLGIAAANVILASVSMRRGDIDGALELSAIAYRHGRRCDDLVILSDSLLTSAIGYRESARYNEALQACYKALELQDSIRIPRKRAVVLLQLATIYSRLSDFKSALRFGHEARECAEISGDQDVIATALHPLYMTYVELGDYGESLRLQEDALRIYETLNMDHEVAGSHCNIGWCRMQLCDWKNAIKHIHLALNIFATKHKGGKYSAMCTLNLAAIHLELNDDVLAEQLLQEVLLEPYIGQWKRIHATALAGLGNVYLKRSGFKRALEFYQAAYALFEERAQIALQIEV